MESLPSVLVAAAVVASEASWVSLPSVLVVVFAAGLALVSSVVVSSFRKGY